MLRGAKGVYWGAKRRHGVLYRAAGRLWGAAGVTGVLGGGSVWCSRLVMGHCGGYSGANRCYRVLWGGYGAL